MRLEEFDTKYNLDYILGDIQSMRKALNDYTKLIESGEAFEDSYCVAHFKHQGEPVSIDYFKEHRELKAYIEESSPFFNINSDRKNLQLSTTGEALFFLCAATVPEMEGDLKKACEIIAAFSRRTNDSADMWLTCETPFGIEPLQITATKYPKYGYLLAAFLIPYWDDEHMPEALFALGDWSSKQGINEDTLKAFCYCDNSRARENMLGYDTWDGGFEEGIQDSEFDLLNYFRSNPGRYKEFKDILVERYKEMPYLQYSDDSRDYEKDPTRNLIMEILYLHHPYNTWEDDHDIDDWLTNRFIDSQADEAIVELKGYVEKELGRPITSLKESNSQIVEGEPAEFRGYIKVEVARDGETEKWRELFLKVLPQGEELWRYVLEGGDRDILEDLTPIDLIEEGVKNKCVLGKEFKDACYGEPLEEEIHPFIRDFIHERKIKYSMKTATSVSDNEALRLYDILHRIMGEPSLPRLVLKMLRNTYIDLDRAGARTYIKERYSVSWRKRVQEIIKSIAEMDYQGITYLFDQLEELYLLIEENRRKIREMASEWFNMNPEGIDPEYTRRSENPQAAYTLIGIFILWKDKEREDEITNRARIFVEEKASEVIYKYFTSHAQWPKIEIMDGIEEYTVETEYQRNYKEKVLEGYQLWKPFEEYLITGKFKKASSKESFVLALKYLKDHLEVDEESRISEKQPYYDCFSSEENGIFYASICYLSIKVGSLKCKGLLERSFKLGFGMAPMRMIDLLEPIIPELSTPTELPKFLERLNELRGEGLSDEVYWAVQLQKLSDNLDAGEIDLEELKGYSSNPEDKAKKYYVRLLRLYTDMVVPKIELTDPLWLMFEELVSIQEALIEGSKLLDNKYQARYIEDAIKVFGANPRYQVMLDRLAIGKLKEELKNNIKTPANYYKAYLEMIGVSYREERITLDDMDLEYLGSLGVEPLSDEAYLKLKKFYEGDEKGWVQQCVIKEEEKIKPLYNLEALSFAAEAKRRGEKCYVNSFFIVFIDKECPKIHEEVIPQIHESYKDQNYGEFVMGCFEKFLNGREGFDSIKMLLKCAVNEYGFFDGIGWYNGIQIDEIFSYLSECVQKQILTILSGVSHEKLKKVLNRENEDKYLDIMIEEEINPEEIFRYLVTNGKRYHLKKMASIRDCTEYIRAAKVGDIVTALAYIGAIPRYHTLVVELKEHKSIKVKAIVEKLIDVHKIDMDNPNPYKVVDYGIYRMGTKENTIEGREGITREAFEPQLVKETTTVEAKVGMYIGLRFTAKQSEYLPKVCNHRVVVTHPYRDKAGEVKEGQSKWDQNGYSNSAIFLGWCFEEMEELITGNYTFEAYDILGNLIAKKQFVVRV